MFGTLSGLMNQLLVYQQIYQVKQLALSLLTKIMLEYTHLQLVQRLETIFHSSLKEQEILVYILHLKIKTT